MINEVRSVALQHRAQSESARVSENGGATWAEATELPPPRKPVSEKGRIRSWAARPGQKQSCADILELVLTFSQNPMAWFIVKSGALEKSILRLCVNISVVLLII